MLIGKPAKFPGYYFSSYSPELNLYTCNRMQCPIEIFEGIFGLQKIYICMLFSGVHIWTAVYALKICSFYSYRTYALPFQNIPCSQIRNRIRGQIVHQTLKPPLKNYARSSLQYSPWIAPLLNVESHVNLLPPWNSRNLCKDISRISFSYYARIKFNFTRFQWNINNKIYRVTV